MKAIENKDYTFRDGWFVIQFSCTRGERCYNETTMEAHSAFPMRGYSIFPHLHMSTTNPYARTNNQCLL